MYRSSQASAAACRSKIASRLRATFAASVSRWNIRNARPLALGRLDREPAGGEREQIGRQRLRLGEREREPARRLASRRFGAVGDRLPSRRHVERQRPARLEVRLVEAGNARCARAGHEQRVEEVGVAVERGVAGDEIDRDLVVAARRAAGGKHDVAATT